MKKVKLLPLLVAFGLVLTGCATTGETGPQGPKGDTGAQGEKGDKGEPGQTPFIGENGNWWIGETDTGVPATGADGEDGTDGTNGTNGTNGTDGVNGEDGKDGTSMHTGNGAPSADLGQEGDSYVDLDTWDFYVKDANGWTKKGNIKGEDYERETHTVTFETLGGTVIASQEVLHGEKVQKPANPTKDGNEFLGWTYGDEAWAFGGHVVTEDMTLTANWEYDILSIANVTKKVAGATLETTQYNTTTTTNLLWGENENGRTHSSSKVDSFSGNTITTYYAFDANGNPYSYQIEGEKLSKNSATITAAAFDGPSTYIGGNSYYGAAGLLNYMNAFYPLDNNKINYMDDNTIYVEYLAEQYGSKNLTQIQADLVYNNGTLEGVNFSHRTVYQYELIQDVELGVWYPAEDCSTKFVSNNYTFSYGDSTLELPHTIEDFYYESYDLVDTDGEIVEELTLENGVSATLSIANGAPSTANYQFDTPVVTTLEGATGAATASFNTFTGKLTINPTTIGELTLNITTKNVTKQINVEVVEPQVASISMKTYKAPTWEGGNYSATAITSALTMFEGESLLMGAQIAPNGASQGYTLTADSEDVVLTLAHENVKTTGLSYQSIYVDIYSVTCAKAGTYEITATSTKDTTKSVTVTLEVVAAPTIEEIVANDYWHYYGGNGHAIDKNIYIEFAPSEDNAALGTVTIQDYFTNKYNSELSEEEKLITRTHDYSYDAATKVFTLSTDGTNVEYYLQVNDDYTGIDICDDRTGEDAIAIAGFTAKVYDPIVYLSGEWFETEENLGIIYLMLNNGRGMLNDGTAFTYTVTINEDGSMTVNVDADGLTAICTDLGIDSITSIVLDATYETITITYVTGGETLTTTLSK